MAQGKCLSVEYGLQMIASMLGHRAGADSGSTVSAPGTPQRGAGLLGDGKRGGLGKKYSLAAVLGFYECSF